MKRAIIFTTITLAAMTAGCARWEPETNPVELTQACPGKRAPVVGEVPELPVRATYNFVIEGVSDADLKAFLAILKSNGFSLVPMMFNLNGEDTLFANGPAVLGSQSGVDAEFNLACRTAVGDVYLTHVRFNSADADGPTRVR